MAEEYYKLYGKNTGNVAGAVNITEESVIDVCGGINASDIAKEPVLYSKIDEKEYNEIRSELVKKILNKK